MEIRIAFHPGLRVGFWLERLPIQAGVANVEIGGQPCAGSHRRHRHIVANGHVIEVGQSATVEGVRFLGVPEPTDDAYTWLFEQILEGPETGSTVVVSTFSPWAEGGRFAGLIAEPIDAWIYIAQENDCGGKMVAGTKVIGVQPRGFGDTWITL